MCSMWRFLVHSPIQWCPAVQVYVGIVAVFLPAQQFEAQLILENVCLAFKALAEFTRQLCALYVYRCLFSLPALLFSAWHRSFFL